MRTARALWAIGAGMLLGPAAVTAWRGGYQAVGVVLGGLLVAYALAEVADFEMRWSR